MLFFLMPPCFKKSDQRRVLGGIKCRFYVYKEKLELYSPNVPPRPELQARQMPCVLLGASFVGGRAESSYLTNHTKESSFIQKNSPWHNLSYFLFSRPRNSQYISLEIRKLKRSAETLARWITSNFQFPRPQKYVVRKEHGPMPVVQTQRKGNLSQDFNLLQWLLACFRAIQGWGGGKRKENNLVL